MWFYTRDRKSRLGPQRTGCVSCCSWTGSSTGSCSTRSGGRRTTWNFRPARSGPAAPRSAPASPARTPLPGPRCRGPLGCACPPRPRPRGKGAARGRLPEVPQQTAGPQAGGDPVPEVPGEGARSGEQVRRGRGVSGRSRRLRTARFVGGVEGGCAPAPALSAPKGGPRGESGDAAFPGTFAGIRDLQTGLSRRAAGRRD
jgi:hypothetical protein